MNRRMIFATLFLVQLLLLSLPIFAVPVPLLCVTQESSAAAPPPPEDKLWLDIDTPLIIASPQDIKAGENEPGDKLTFYLSQPCRINHVCLLPKGTPVQVTVLESRHAKMFARPGELELRADFLRLENGSTVAVRSNFKLIGNQEVGWLRKVLPYCNGIANFTIGLNAVVPKDLPLTIFLDENVPFSVSADGSVRRIP